MLSTLGSFPAGKQGHLCSKVSPMQQNSHGKILKTKVMLIKKKTNKQSQLPVMCKFLMEILLGSKVVDPCPLHLSL